MNPRKVVIHEAERIRKAVILQLHVESIRQQREAAHRHAHRQEFSTKQIEQMVLTEFMLDFCNPCSRDTKAAPIAKGCGDGSQVNAHFA
jgi:hypothetical protein